MAKSFGVKVTKTSIMLGLGETRDELLDVFADLLDHGVDFLTLGQYLQPTKKHHAVIRFVEPDEFKAFCSHVKEAATIRANPVDKDDLQDYRDMKRIFEKSVVTARAVQAGQVLQLADLAFKKPGDGIPAARHAELLGRQARRALAADHKITWEDLK
jgi:hypothetical protein